MAIQSRFWKIFDLILLIVVLVIGAWATVSYFNSRTENKGSYSNNFTVFVSIDAGKGDKIDSPVEYSTDPAPTGLTVLSVLRSAAEMKGLDLDIKEYPGMGSLVTKIGDVQNGENGAYWQFWVNGTYGSKSADSIQANPGDRIEWKYSSSTQ